MTEGYTLANRLRWAMSRHDWREGRRRGLRLFQKRMDERAKELDKAGGQRPEGVSKSSIQTYLSGKVVPPLPFLREAASVLGLREAWLISGDGFATEAENEAAAVNREKPSQALGRILRLEKLGDELEAGGLGFWELPDSTRESVLHGLETYRRLAFFAQKQGLSPDREAVTQRYISYLAAPFAILGIDRASLEPLEQALLIDSLLRPLDIARLALSREAGEAAAERTRRNKNPMLRWLLPAPEPDRKARRKRPIQRRRSKKRKV